MAFIKTEYTLKEKRQYHANLSKKGAVSPNTGEPVTDFQRGVHLAKAQSYGNRATSNAIKFYSEKGETEKVAAINESRKTFKAEEKSRREEYKAQKAAEHKAPKASSVKKK